MVGLVNCISGGQGSLFGLEHMIVQNLSGVRRCLHGLFIMPGARFMVIIRMFQSDIEMGMKMSFLLFPEKSINLIINWQRMKRQSLNVREAENRDIPVSRDDADYKIMKNILIEFERNIIV